MIRSMTAYGRAKQQLGGKDITVEIKSVNNRYFDCSVKLPRLYGFLEERTRSYIKERGISRGKLDVFITIDVIDTQGTEVTLDQTYTRSYLEALYRLRDTFSLKDDISVMRVAANRDIFAVTRAEEDTEGDWQDLRTVLDEALQSFLSMREAEGARLADDLRQKKAALEKHLPEIEALSEEDTRTYAQRLEERLQKILCDHALDIDRGRILTECAVFADKVAVDEETVRLRSHFRAFDEMLTSDEPIGRKLDFLIQEMNRETNTIGSKASNIEIARIVIEMKNEIEKIREQVQNIE
ncbi:MAG: YicC family protein [Clostridia bacterium]|nr:YicC family protein [Clostridia bacterium]